MNQKQKGQLRSAFAAPPPKHKQAFLQELPLPRAGLREFIKSQFAYIRLRIWAASLAILVFAVYQAGAGAKNAASVWTLASALPLFVFILVNELGRSDFFGMSELELPCKHKLAHIVLARVGILGGVQLLLLLILQLLLFSQSGLPFFEFGFYFNLPLFLSVFLSLFFLNRLKPADARAVCALGCGAVCMGGVILFEKNWAALQSGYLIYWYSVTILLIFGIARELMAFVKSTGEYKWR